VIARDKNGLVASPELHLAVVHSDDLLVGCVRLSYDSSENGWVSCGTRLGTEAFQGAFESGLHRKDKRVLHGSVRATYLLLS
jgi:hypothetical protein